MNEKIIWLWNITGVLVIIIAVVALIGISSSPKHIVKYSLASSGTFQFAIRADIENAQDDIVLLPGVPIERVVAIIDSLNRGLGVAK